MSGTDKTRRKRLSYPRVGTRAAEDYFRTYQQIYRYFNWVLFMASKMDDMAKIARKALLSIKDNSVRMQFIENASKPRKGMIDELKENRQFFIEIILVRHVDNYLNYLSGLLFDIFLQRPETLRTSEQVELASVLRHGSLNEFIRAEAERRVEKLTYQSFDDLHDYFSERFNIQLFERSQKTVIMEAIEIRNISVHNRCRINERYSKRTGTNVSKVGKLRELYIDDLDELVPILFEGVQRLDRSIRKKLKLKGIRFGDIAGKDATLQQVATTTADQPS